MTTGLIVSRTCADCRYLQPVRLQRLVFSAYIRRWLWRCLSCHVKYLSWEMNYQEKMAA